MVNSCNTYYNCKYFTGLTIEIYVNCFEIEVVVQKVMIYALLASKVALWKRVFSRLTNHLFCDGHPGDSAQ